MHRSLLSVPGTYHECAECTECTDCTQRTDFTDSIDHVGCAVCTSYGYDNCDIFFFSIFDLSHGI